VVNKGMQLVLAQGYRQALRQGDPLPGFDQVAFRTFSQTQEDGILWFLFSILGTTNRRCLEICAGDGIECNTANLIINHGWRGLLVDGSRQNIQRGQDFYARFSESRVDPPRLLQAWITSENVNDIVAAHCGVGDIDLLSLDLDGMDYWIWKSLSCVRPRVVVAEYESSLGPELSLTRPYQPDFTGIRLNGWPPGGASLSALVALGREKSYRLVGCNPLCFNAFFLRNDIGADLFPEVSASSCFHHELCPLRFSKQDELRRLGTWLAV
jgi:hypothetical protein